VRELRVELHAGSPKIGVGEYARRGVFSHS
jgi:hypothetical protein